MKWNKLFENKINLTNNIRIKINQKIKKYEPY